ncbi:GNAT family N-acetyltransferase [Methylobacterium sp. JK268]
MSATGAPDHFAPIITERLRLRCPRADDAEAVSRMLTPAISRWLASWPVPFTPAMAAERIAAARRAVAENRALICAIDGRADGILIGWIGVVREAQGCGTLGYWLGEAHHGRGVMREAAPALVAAAFARLDLAVIEASANPENAASLGVMRACGMWPAGTRVIHAPARGRDEACLVYRIASPTDPAAD